MSKLQVGDRITVDKGILGVDSGKLLSVKGWSIGGLWGEYENTKGEVRVFDQTVHKISLGEES